MALNLSPELGVKLTKKDRERVARKIKRGWKAIVLIPDYFFDENGDIQVRSPKNRRFVKIVKILDDGIYIEKALKNKSLRMPWGKIVSIEPTNNIKNGLELVLVDGKTVDFGIYNSYKYKQIMEYIINYVNNKKIENNSNIEMHN